MDSCSGSSLSPTLDNAHPEIAYIPLSPESVESEANSVTISLASVVIGRPDDKNGVERPCPVQDDKYDDTSSESPELQQEGKPQAYATGEVRAVTPTLLTILSISFRVIFVSAVLLLLVLVVLAAQATLAILHAQSQPSVPSPPAPTPWGDDAITYLNNLVQYESGFTLAYEYRESTAMVEGHDLQLFAVAAVAHSEMGHLWQMAGGTAYTRKEARRSAAEAWLVEFEAVFHPGTNRTEVHSSPRASQSDGRHSFMPLPDIH